jgi:hypothetical protein
MYNDDQISSHIKETKLKLWYNKGWITYSNIKEKGNKGSQKFLKLGVQKKMVEQVYMYLNDKK